MYSCMLCGKSYNWPGDLRRHTKFKHSGPSGHHSISAQGHRTMECLLCGKSFLWPSDLRRHMRVKHPKSKVGKNNAKDEISEDQHRTDVIHLPYVKQTWMQFRHPGSAMIVGPSGCGKTSFIVRFLTHLSKMIDQKIDEIIWCYGIKQEFHKDIQFRFPKVTFVEGLPDYSTFDASKTRICIIDDLMSETKGNIVSDLFSKVSHHSNTTVLYIVQNLFPKSKEQRDISLNTKYFIIFKNPRDNKQVGMLGAQMGKHDLIKHAYEHATSKPHGYLMIDVTQGANDKLRVRSNIFPDDDVNIVYLP